jgi:hypothetical protein
MMQTEIKSPAITVRAERGRDGVDEGTTIGGSVIANEEPRVTVAFAGGSRVVKEEFEFGELVEASVNVTVNGAVPDNGVPVKFAAGAAGGVLTVIYFMRVELEFPAAFFTFNATV